MVDHSAASLSEVRSRSTNTLLFPALAAAVVNLGPDQFSKAAVDPSDGLSDTNIIIQALDLK